MFDGGSANLYSYVGNDPINFIDPEGTDIVNLTGDDRINEFVEHALYKSLNQDPNVIVTIVYGKLPGSMAGLTQGGRKRITITIDPSKAKTKSQLANTLFHELIHANQLRSGNLSGKKKGGRADIPFAEKEAYDFSDTNYPRECP